MLRSIDLSLLLAAVAGAQKVNNSDSYTQPGGTLYDSVATRNRVRAVAAAKCTYDLDDNTIAPADTGIGMLKITDPKCAALMNNRGKMNKKKPNDEEFMQTCCDTTKSADEIRNTGECGEGMAVRHGWVRRARSGWRRIGFRYCGTFVPEVKIVNTRGHPIVEGDQSMSGLFYHDCTFPINDRTVGCTDDLQDCAPNVARLPNGASYYRVLDLNQRCNVPGICGDQFTNMTCRDMLRLPDKDTETFSPMQMQIACCKDNSLPNRGAYQCAEGQIQQLRYIDLKTVGYGSSEELIATSELYNGEVPTHLVYKECVAKGTEIAGNRYLDADGNVATPPGVDDGTSSGGSSTDNTDGTTGGSGSEGGASSDGTSTGGSTTEGGTSSDTTTNSPGKVEIIRNEGLENELRIPFDVIEFAGNPNLALPHFPSFSFPVKINEGNDISHDGCDAALYKRQLVFKFKEGVPATCAALLQGNYTMVNLEAKSCQEYLNDPENANKGADSVQAFDEACVFGADSRSPGVPSVYEKNTPIPSGEISLHGGQRSNLDYGYDQGGDKASVEPCYYSDEHELRRGVIKAQDRSASEWIGFWYCAKKKSE